MNPDRPLIESAESSGDLPRVRFLSGSVDGAEVIIPASGGVLGRSRTSLVRFDQEVDTLVSRAHVAFNRDTDGVWWIEDLRSSNGTWCHAMRLEGRAPIPTRENEYSLGPPGTSGSVGFYVAFPSLRRAARAGDPPRVSVREILREAATPDSEDA